MTFFPILLFQYSLFSCFILLASSVTDVVLLQFLHSIMGMISSLIVLLYAVVRVCRVLLVVIPLL
ncbi:hypothetical protein I3843_16G111200 [Carya illinoinensis]|nr:hypothetical protein I3843_16G111200 [Carya illinoinensis]